jgi:peptidyl-prolyl cis-trans isomerase C
MIGTESMQPSKINRLFTMTACLLCFGIAVALPLASGCNKKEDLAGKTVVARVNGKPIFREELERQILLIDRNFPARASESESRKFSGEVLRQMIRRRLLLQEAAKKQITVTPAAASKMISEQTGEMSREDREEALKNAGITYEEWKNRLLDDQIIDQLVRTVIRPTIQVSDKELEAYYQDHPQEFQTPERVRVRQIVLAKEEEARQVRKRITDGKEDFALVAVEVSLSPDAAEGGEIGTFARGQMPKEFDDVCFSLEIGEISPVVKSPYGYHIFQVEERFPAGQESFKEARDKIYKKLLEDKEEKAFQEHQKNLWNQAKISILLNKEK